jgi:hypothetical protein
MPDPTEDLTRRLRAEADRLDDAVPSISTADVRSGRAATPTSRRWLPAAAAVVILAGIGAAWLLTSDDDPEQLIVPAEDATTTTTTATTTTLEETVDWDSLPALGIAITTPGRPMRLLDLDGNDLGVMAEPTATLIGPTIDLPTTTPPDPTDPAEVPDGCESAFAGGGVRVSLCGGEPQQPTQIDLVDASGERIRLSGVPFDDTAPTGVRTGLWRWALPSPDGRWVLAQWSGECEVPEAFLTPTAGGGVPLHLDPVPAWTTSRGLGWTPDGRAIIELGDGACGSTAEVPGVYLLDPDTRDMTLVVELTEQDRAFVWNFAPPANVPERMLARALDELGLEACCGEPSHGGPAVTSGAVFEGAEIGINGVPLGGALVDHDLIQTMPLLHGEANILDPPADALVDGVRVEFGCGSVIWVLSWWAEGQPEVDSMLLLAEMLVPHLYCTLPPR